MDGVIIISRENGEKDERKLRGMGRARERVQDRRVGGRYLARLSHLEKMEPETRSSG